MHRQSRERTCLHSFTEATSAFTPKRAPCKVSEEITPTLRIQESRHAIHRCTPFGHTAIHSLMAPPLHQRRRTGPRPSASFDLLMRSFRRCSIFSMALRLL